MNSSLYSDYVKLLKQAVSIKSISTDKSFSADIAKMSKWCESTMKEIGFKTKTFKEYGNPIVFGHLVVNASLPTVLHYGHYDVQPADKSEGWDTHPFKVKENPKTLVGRGVVDNKGQFLIYLSAIASLTKEKKLKYNVKFIIEGDEETGSGRMQDFIAENKELVKADFALISDGEQLNDQPTIDVSYRGSMNATVTVYGPITELHSGLYGGLVQNPINVLSSLVYKLANEYGDTLLFKKGVSVVSEKDEKKMAGNSYNRELFTKITGQKPRFKYNHEIFNYLGFESTIQITSIIGGYSGEGYKNAVPNKASVKINVRYNPDLEPEKVASEFTKYIKQNFLSGVKFDIKIDDNSAGVSLESSNAVFEKASTLLADIYQKPVMYNYCGATLPVAADLKSQLGIPTVFVGLANEDCNMHGANENLNIGIAKKGLEFVSEFLSK
ncbi:M20 family dipeptidase [bacterium]|nr:M20 family dipeptidase [bacterium]